MESFWASHNDEWRFAMSSNDSPMGEQLNKLIKYVKDRGLKTVFWNKKILLIMIFSYSPRRNLITFLPRTRT